MTKSEGTAAAAVVTRSLNIPLATCFFYYAWWMTNRPIARQELRSLKGSATNRIQMKKKPSFPNGSSRAMVGAGFVGAGFVGGVIVGSTQSSQWTPPAFALFLTRRTESIKALRSQVYTTSAANALPSLAGHSSCTPPWPDAVLCCAESWKGLKNLAFQVLQNLPKSIFLHYFGGPRLWATKTRPHQGIAASAATAARPGSGSQVNDELRNWGIYNEH